jgi:preprotein translocase subunit SecE
MIIRLLLVIIIFSYIFYWASDNVFGKKIEFIKAFIIVLAGSSGVGIFLYLLSELLS